MGVDDVYNLGGQVSTFDDIEVVAGEFPVAEENTAYLDVIVMARNVVTGDSALWHKLGTVKMVGGVLSAVDNFLDLHPDRKDQGAVLWNARWVVANNRIELRLKGDPTDEVLWYVDGRIRGYRLGGGLLSVPPGA